jgi:hypothetical protein
MRTEWDGGHYEQQRRVFGETLGSWTCVAFCRACAPYAFTRHLTSWFRRERRTAFREALQFIVMSVMVVISLYLWGYGVTLP